MARRRQPAGVLPRTPPPTASRLGEATGKPAGAGSGRARLRLPRSRCAGRSAPAAGLRRGCCHALGGAPLCPQTSWPGTWGRGLTRRPLSAQAAPAPPLPLPLVSPARLRQVGPVRVGSVTRRRGACACPAGQSRSGGRCPGGCARGADGRLVVFAERAFAVAPAARAHLCGCSRRPGSSFPGARRWGAPNEVRESQSQTRSGK